MNKKIKPFTSFEAWQETLLPEYTKESELQKFNNIPSSDIASTLALIHMENVLKDTEQEK